MLSRYGRQIVERWKLHRLVNNALPPCFVGAILNALHYSCAVKISLTRGSPGLALQVYGQGRQFHIAGQQVDQGTHGLVAEVALDLPPALFDCEEACPPELFHVMGYSGTGDSEILSDIANAFAYFLVIGAGLTRRAELDQAQKYGQAVRIGQCLEYFGESLQLLRVICRHV